MANKGDVQGFLEGISYAANCLLGRLSGRFKDNAYDVDELAGVVVCDRVFSSGKRIENPLLNDIFFIYICK